MKVIAKGFARYEDTKPVTVLTITPQAAEDHAGLRHDLWWEFTYVPSLWDRLVDRIPDKPTAASTFVGGLLVAAAFLAVLGLAGWVEGGMK